MSRNQTVGALKTKGGEQKFLVANQTARINAQAGDCYNQVTPARA
ncbi:MAG TPA: hypothetical protein VLC46_23820 [Thermoanaerobaculia bacterium]|nr:hypothetical protein [Thermoanaerobaculia bacterium]